MNCMGVNVTSIVQLNDFIMLCFLFYIYLNGNSSVRAVCKFSYAIFIRDFRVAIKKLSMYKS